MATQAVCQICEVSGTVLFYAVIQQLILVPAQEIGLSAENQRRLARRETVGGVGKAHLATPGGKFWPKNVSSDFS